MKTPESKASSETSHSSSSLLADQKSDSFFATGKQEPASFFGPQFIQPKLKIGQPNDKYEQEADRVADRVMRMPEPSVQRKCKECEKEEKLQKKGDVQASGSGKSFAGQQLSSQIKSKSGTGSPLPKNVRSEMGSKMGADFSGVSIHTDSKSHQLNRQLGARAFTHGPDVFFSKGEYNPNSQSGKRLLAHELAHVKQQDTNSLHTKIQRMPLTSNCREPIEEMQHSGYCPGISREENELEDYESIGPTVQQTGLDCWTIMNLPSGDSFLTEQEELAPIVNHLMITDPTAEALITGYTDCISQSGPELNRKLRYQRANSIEQQLIDMGVHKSQLWIDTAAADEYLASNSTSQGRAVNRGVTISISTNIIDTKSEGELEPEEPQGSDPCAPISMDLPSFVSSQIQIQRRELNAILKLIDRKVGHIALGIQITGSAEGGMGAGGAIDIVGVVDAEAPRQVEFEMAGAGQLSTGAGGGISVRMLVGYNIIPINENPGSNNFGSHGLVYGLSGSYIVGAGVSISHTLILDILDEQDHRGWIVFTLGAGAEAEVEASASYGTSGTELCKILAPIISQIFGE